MYRRGVFCRLRRRRVPLEAAAAAVDGGAALFRGAVHGLVGGRRHAGAAAGFELPSVTRLGRVQFAACRSSKAYPSCEPQRTARSGEKYTTPQGFTAIKDGVKPAAGTRRRPTPARTAQRLPAWLRAPLAAGAEFAAVKQIVREHRLSTVCEEAKCPNIGECWNAGTATIMLMGAVCTRACRFCAVDTGNPRGWLDPEEPENVARSVELMGLKYVVLTSVNRDDLPDGGAAHYAAAIRAIKRRNPGTAVEALTPDFQGVMRDVQTVARFRTGCVRAECGDGRALDSSGARSARRLRADHRACCGRRRLIGRRCSPRPA